MSTMQGDRLCGRASGLRDQWRTHPRSVLPARAAFRSRFHGTFRTGALARPLDALALFGSAEPAAGRSPAHALYQITTLFASEPGHERPVTIGEARRELQRRLRRNALLWLHAQVQSGVQADALYDLFAA
jgi:hypothetical protein